MDQLTAQLVDWLKSCGNVKEFIDLFNSLRNSSTVGIVMRVFLVVSEGLVLPESLGVLSAFVL